MDAEHELGSKINSTSYEWQNGITAIKPSVKYDVKLLYIDIWKEVHKNYCLYPRCSYHFTNKPGVYEWGDMDHKYTAVALFFKVSLGNHMILVC